MNMERLGNAVNWLAVPLFLLWLWFVAFAPKG